MNATQAIAQVRDWLLDHGADLAEPTELLAALAAQLAAVDVPVDRILVGTLIMHPQADAYGIEWRSDTQQATSVVRSRRSFEALRYPNNPIDRTNGRTSPLHLPLDPSEPDPVLRGLARDGYRDFMAMPLMFQGRFHGAITLATRAESGFSQAAEDVLAGIMGALRAVLRPHILGLVHRTLLRAYLGRDAGDRVYKGQVVRGDGETLRTAIWFSDLRGFTHLSATQSRDAVLGLLNDVFEAQVNSVHAHGGQVLKFMGDGMLATFLPSPTDVDGAEACAQALAAARDAQVALDRLNGARVAEGASPAAVGIGLHFGDVSYGNIGSDGRLDFTVIGAAVNLAARIEALCGSLAQPILLSDAFRSRSQAATVALGEHAVKGVEGRVVVHAPVWGA